MSTEETTLLAPQRYTSPLFTVPPQVLMEIASGIEEPTEIAKRWGLKPDQLDAVLKTPAIKHQIEAKRSELKATGATFRMKAEVLAEELMVDIYHEAMHPDAPRGFKLEVVKWLTKIADREPKQSANIIGGGLSGFSLQINIPSIPGVTPASAMDITPTLVLEDDDTGKPIKQTTSAPGETAAVGGFELPDWLKDKAFSMASELQVPEDYES
jgi:hypothetical protein